MTSGRGIDNPAFLSPHPSYPGGVRLPGFQELRVRKSFENIHSDDDTATGENDGNSRSADSKGGAMDTDFDDLPPDYGEDSMEGLDDVRHVTDLSSLPHLTEAAVLEVVKIRYKNDQIFTRCGDVLISVNPFKQLTIFGEEAHEAFSLDSLSNPNPDPHLFWIAAQAIARRQREKINQVVLISGESGAGKTEASKLMLRHILHLSTSCQDRLYESIDKVNPLIELYGNARTLLNENSSRFAKFLDVRFSSEGAVTGAIVRDYILEKSRVVSQSPGESNFHIFYTFLDDVMSNPSRQKLFLMDGMNKHEDFRIVPPDSWRRTESGMSSEDQAKVLKQIGVSPVEMENVHIILAAILHLTNIQFEEDDGSTGGVVVENEITMRKAAALLNVDDEQLARVLVTKTGKFAGQEIQTFNSLSKAEEARDAMAKALYERLFGWLIRTINMALNRQHSQEAGVGFLDICGFEDLRHNSLEQMCINLANENLQKFMNTQVFEQEMKVYHAEGIHLGDINPPSNEFILRMFDEPKRGILALINEDTRVEISTTNSLVQKLLSIHAKSSYFMPYKNNEPRFGVQHFAAPVWYNAHQFLEKNGDNLNKEVKDLLVASSNELVSDIFTVTKAPTGSIAPTPFNYRVSQKHNINFQQHSHMKLSASVVRGLGQTLKDRFHGKIPKMDDPDRSKMSDQQTVIDCFQTSMKELLEKMKNAQPFFVRCIKPNDQQTRDNFEDKKVRLQLRYNGLTEIAKIRRVWFPVRLPISDFIRRYCQVYPDSKKIADKKEAATTILRHVRAPKEHWRLGRTTIFLKDQVATNLDKELNRHKEEEKRKAAEKARKDKEAAEKQKKADEERQRQEEEERVKETRRKLPTVAEVALSPGKARGGKKLTVLEPVDEMPTPLPTPSSSGRTNPVETQSSSCSEDEESSTDSAPPEQNGGGGNPAVGEGDNEQEDESKYNYWDTFRIVAREREKTDIRNLKAMMIIKAFAYVLIFLIVLVTGTAQKVSLMIIVAAMKIPEQIPNEDSGKRRDRMAMSTAYYILMMVAICIPYMLTFFVSFAKFLFGGFRNPSAGTWIWVFCVESLHSLGMTLLVFRVLPRVDVVHGLLLLTAVGLIPSILKLVTSVDARSQNPTSRKWRIFKRTMRYILDFLAFAGQASVFPAVFALGYVSTNADEDVLTALDVIGAMLVSVACWENFMDGRFFVQLGDMNPIKNFMLKRRFDLQRGRYIPQFVVSAWKIIVTSVLAYVYRGERNFDYEKAFETLGNFHNEWKLITAVCVLTLSALVCYYFAYIACKLWMQRFSFVVPVFFATPCAILVFFLDSKYQFLTSVTGTQRNSAVDVVVTWPDDLLSHWKTLTFGVAFLVSLILLTRHVWQPRQSRLAKFETMFVNLLYCGILTTETLLMNRRRHTLSCRKKRVSDTTCFYKLDKREKRTDSQSDYVDDTYAEIPPSGEHYDPENPYDTSTYGGNKKKTGDEEVPTIYACATMWHEVRREMIALLKSLHRIDLEQWTKRQAQDMSGTRDKDFFNFEAHIFFDDAMTLDDNEEFIPNDYVKMVVEVMEEAVSSVYKKAMTVHPPFKIPTPYGGQLLWIMPGRNPLFVHLKDKSKIRHRKRWSQVMYMYYLLGFRLTRQCQEQIIEALRTGRADTIGWTVDREDVGVGVIFEALDEGFVKRSQNTFVMALDGDTDFYPGAVHILLDRMKKNPKVGAACGRIHPIGSGPMVWYQMFEYAIGHWMQKATEHVLGCVLCSPGCFSLFRGSALMDDNVMRKYSILPTEPSDFLQYDQGEDRWLCTLLLQQGYRVDYAAAAEAWTYAPEGFNEFFNQRRRWMPSTLANVMDLLADYSNTVAINSNISMLYIVYQVALMVATILGPGTVLMMIAGAIGVVFNVNLVWSYVIAVVPAAIYLGVCLGCKTDVQLYLAAIMSTFYAFVMMIVFVGVIVTAAQTSIFHPSVLVIAFLLIIFLVAGLCHPMEMYCLPSGALYLLCIPSGYLLLVIYSLANLHVVSWGTREAPKKKTKAELEEEKLEAAKKEEEKAKKKGFFSRFFFSSYLNDLKDIIQSATGSNKTLVQEDKSMQLLQQINDNLSKLAEAKGVTPVQKEGKDSGSPTLPADVSMEEGKGGKGVKAKKGKGKGKAPKKKVQISVEQPVERTVRNDLENPRWIEDKGLGNGDVMKLYDEEMTFWKSFIKEYLRPLDSDKDKEKEMSKNLIELRNSVCFAVGMLNLLWIAINFMFQYTVPITLNIPIGDGVPVDILGLLFVLFLLAILLLQIIGMIVHRWGTLLHLLASTDINLPCCSKKDGALFSGLRDENERKLQQALDFCQAMNQEPLPDYLEDDAPTGMTNKQIAEEILRKTVVGGSVAAFDRRSVVQQLNQSGVLNSNFISSPQFGLYLRGTRRARDEVDVEASQFVSEFRSNINDRRRYRPNSNGFLGNADGYAPAPPRRQASGFNRGVRRRINANNLRYTVRDTIDRIERDVGITVQPSHGPGGEDGGGAMWNGFGGGGEGGGEGGGDHGGVLDRAFSRRMQLFNNYSRGPGHNYSRGPRGVLDI